MTRSTARLFVAVVRPLQAFLHTEAAGGVLLLVCALGALLWANLDPISYAATFDFPLALGAGSLAARFSLRALINDGLMTVFFFVVGMEIKRELTVGELDTLRKASLPAIAALGGMVVPAAFFLAFTQGSGGEGGWGIPMATDIAFCVGILTLLRDRVPAALIVFVTALAIFDDIGGILVIAFFYGHGLQLGWLLAAALVTALLYAMNRARVDHGLAYALIGLLLWYTLHHSGIHATIAGVVLGLMVPAQPRRSSREVLSALAGHLHELAHRRADEALDAAEVLAIEQKLESVQAPTQRLIHILHPLVAFAVMPAFALANAGVELGAHGLAALASPVALGTATGLFLGKQLGIFSSTMLAVKLGLAPIPGAASASKLLGISIIAGVGFTVALFIAALAYADAEPLLEQAKLGILFGSLAAGLVGFALLRLTPRLEPRAEAEASAAAPATSS